MPPSSPSPTRTNYHFPKNLCFFFSFSFAPAFDPAYELTLNVLPLILGGACGLAGGFNPAADRLDLLLVEFAMGGATRTGGGASRV